jgi:glycosyltransferase involved in cell wall biosynthesis
LNVNDCVSILHVITRLIVGGAQENTMYTAARLDPSRFCAEVVSGPQTGSEGSLIDEVRAMGVPLTILPALLREISPAHDLSALRSLRRLMRERHFAIVHTHSSKAGILGRVAAKVAGVPIIVHTVHGWSFHEHMSPRRRRLYVLLERFAARFTDAMIVVAQPDIEKGLAEGIGRLEQYRLIRSAIPLEAFDPTTVDSVAVRQELGIPQDALVLGNVGRFSAQKNPLDWVAIAARVARALPGVYFLLVGDGPLRSEVETALAAAGLTNRTILTGLRRDVPRLLAAMDLFLLTSLWEGLPRVIPQAMSMEIPVVANRADGTVEAIDHGHTGFLCDPGELGAMAEACTRLLQNPELCREMGRRGREYAIQEFGLDRMISDIEALYEELLQRRGTGT